MNYSAFGLYPGRKVGRTTLQDICLLPKCFQSTHFQELSRPDGKKPRDEMPAYPRIELWIFTMKGKAANILPLSSIK